MGIRLKAHNKEAYENVRAMLEKRNCAAVIQPTGTGKSYIALKLIENTEGNVIYVAPSTLIIRQVKETIEEERKNGDISNEEYEKYKRVKYITYSKLMKDALENEHFDQIILDEFHRCGAPEWGKGVQRLLAQNKSSKVLGLTATPLRAVDGKDMAKELFDGNVASEMTLEEAIARGIIKAPVYVNAIYSFKNILAELEGKVNEVEDKKIREELRRKLRRAKELVGETEGFQDIINKYASKQDAKYIVFCRSIKEMHKKMVEVGEAFSKVGQVHLYEISSKKRERLNERALELFRSSKKGINLLFTVDKLNEGIHINGIDGVMMLRQTASPIVYMQQLGRALSAGNEGTPLVLDLVNNIESSNYIYGFVEGIERARKGQKEKQKEEENESSEQQQENNIEVVELQREIKDILRSINEKLSRDMTTTDIVSKYIEHLQRKNEGEENEANIKRYESKIRQAKRRGELTLEQINRLEQVGFIWRGKELTLEDKIRRFIQYGDTKGEKDIRTAKRERRLTQEQIIALENAGMKWRGNEISIDDEIRYMSQNRGTKKGESLVRGQKKAGNLSEEQIEAAEAAGIVWRGIELTLKDAVRILLKNGDIGRIKKDDITQNGVPIGKYKAKVISHCEELSDEDYEALQSSGLEFPKAKVVRRLRKKKQELEEREKQAKALLEECKSTTQDRKKKEQGEENKENEVSYDDDDGNR